MRQPSSGSQEILNLHNRCYDLEQRVAGLEQQLRSLEHLQESMEQLHTLWEGGSPVPIFLRWVETRGEYDCLVSRATFGKYRLNVVNGTSAVTWEIHEGKKLLDWGGGHGSYGYGLMQAEEALQQIVREREQPHQGGNG